MKLQCVLYCYNQPSIIMNRLEFEELELQVQQSGLPLMSYLQQIGVSFYRMTYLENWGSGVGRIIDACQAQGIEAPV